jgi:hypothetical protein
MSAKPRNPYLLPALAAGLVLGAGASTLLLIAFDDNGSAGAAKLRPDVIEQIRAIKAEREWAASVCGILTIWRDDIDEAVDSVVDGFDITEPGTTWEIATTAFGDARDATTTMVEQLKNVETPDTPEGRSLAVGVDRIVDHASGHIEEIGLRVAAIGGDVGVTDGFNVPRLIDEVRALVDDGRADIDALREPASHMLDVLRANDDCTPFLRVLQLD